MPPRLPEKCRFATSKRVSGITGPKKKTSESPDLVHPKCSTESRKRNYYTVYIMYYVHITYMHTTKTSMQCSNARGPRTIYLPIPTTFACKQRDDGIKISCLFIYTFHTTTCRASRTLFREKDLCENFHRRRPRADAAPSVVIVARVSHKSRGKRTRVHAAKTL